MSRETVLARVALGLDEKKCFTCRWRPPMKYEMDYFRHKCGHPLQHKNGENGSVPYPCHQPFIITTSMGLWEPLDE